MQSLCGVRAQMASSYALRRRPHMSPMSVWSSYLPRTLSLPSALGSEVDRHTKVPEPSFLSLSSTGAVGLMLIIIR